MRLAGLGLLALLVVASLLIGAADMSARDLLTTAEGRALLTESRLPRTLAAVLAGAGLAVSG